MSRTYCRRALERIEVDDGAVHIELRITSPSCMMVGYLIEQANERVGRLPGVEEVTLSTDAGLPWRDEMMAEEANLAHGSVAGWQPGRTTVALQRPAAD